MLGAEGLLALQKLGVDPAVALEAINGPQLSQKSSWDRLCGRIPKAI